MVRWWEVWYRVTSLDKMGGWGFGVKTDDNGRWERRETLEEKEERDKSERKVEYPTHARFPDYLSDPVLVEQYRGNKEGV